MFDSKPMVKSLNKQFKHNKHNKHFKHFIYKFDKILSFFFDFEKSYDKTHRKNT